jgi:hypothetical protein
MIAATVTLQMRGPRCKRGPRELPPLTGIRGSGHELPDVGQVHHVDTAIRIHRDIGWHIEP